MARRLTAVPDAPAPARKTTARTRKPPKSVTEAARSGTTRELLVAMRSRIATAVEDPNTPARDLAALTKRLVEVVRDIEALDAKSDQEGSGGPVADAAFDASAV